MDSPRIGKRDLELTPERYQQIKRVFAEACRLKPEQRAAYLDQACAGDADLRAEVEGLLHHDEKSLPIRPRISAAAAFGLDRMDAGAAAGSSALAGFQPAPEQAPERIGDFRIIGKIGQGGMGVVYEAEQDHPRRRIALKVIRPGACSTRGSLRFTRRGRPRSRPPGALRSSSPTSRWNSSAASR